ncbi:MAG: hypothetical protein RLY31_946 [Bacteroidota bacterium]|jgi:hypothetical protein
MPAFTLSNNNINNNTKHMKKLIQHAMAAMLLLITILFFPSCDKEDTTPDNDQELITTVRITVSDGVAEPVSAQVQDLDGIGGNPPTIQELALQPNTGYTFSIAFLDEQNASAPVDITEEVAEESAEHLVCYLVNGNISEPVRTDQDSDGQPLGLEGTFQTGDTGTGTLTVILKHLPDKSGAEPCTTGETDVEVSFPVVIQ